MSIAIRLPDALEKRLENIAKKTKRSKSYIAREALEKYIDNLENYLDAVKINKNPERLYTIEEVMRNCDLGWINEELKNDK